MHCTRYIKHFNEIGLAMVVMANFETDSKMHTEVAAYLLKVYRCQRSSQNFNGQLFIYYTRYRKHFKVALAL